MSEVSVLSREYKTASDLSQTLNRALIALKKKRLNLPGAETLTTEEVERHLRELKDILDAVLALLAPRDSGSRGAERNVNPLFVPGALVARLNTERRGDLAYYVEDLKQASTHLESGLEALTDADIKRLDELAATADAEASGVFRRLMRM